MEFVSYHYEDNASPHAEELPEAPTPESNGSPPMSPSKVVDSDDDIKYETKVVS